MMSQTDFPISNHAAANESSRCVMLCDTDGTSLERLHAALGSDSIQKLFVFLSQVYYTGHVNQHTNSQTELTSH